MTGDHMVKIITGLCKGCGECAAICHESCMKLSDKKITINYDFCSTCGQCIAICPEQALQWDDNRPEIINRNSPVTAEQMRIFLMSRRTDRHFKAEKPPVELIEKIVNMGAYAPAHSHDFRAIAVYEDKTIDTIDAGLFKITKGLYNMYFKNNLIRRILCLLLHRGPKKEYLKALPKLEKSVKNNRSYAIRPPVIVYLVSGKQTPLTLESAQYAIYNMDLYARTLGLGCRNLTGNNMFINKSTAVRKALGLKKDETIYAAAAFGYVSKVFRNIVTGRSFPVSIL
jgi:NAD-dependent dihydropyrimidine dehydrogenase PreA subunit/nitroreductase